MAAEHLGLCNHVRDGQPAEQARWPKTPCHDDFDASRDFVLMVGVLTLVMGIFFSNLEFVVAVDTLIILRFCSMAILDPEIHLVRNRRLANTKDVKGKWRSCSTLILVSNGSSNHHLF